MVLNAASPHFSLSNSPHSQMGMMGNPGGPYGGPYAGQGTQGLGGAGLGPQLHNKGPMSNHLAQFNMDKKNQPMQGMAAMVSNENITVSSFNLSLSLWRKWGSVVARCSDLTHV